MSDKETNPIVGEFLKNGRRASYHYAAEGTDEWQLGWKYERKAMALFDENPDLQKEMLEKGDFLWSVKRNLESREIALRRDAARLMAGLIQYEGAWGRPARIAREKFPGIDEKIIEAMGFAMTIYREETT